MTSSNKVTKRSAHYTNREIHVIMDEYVRRKNILENNTNPQQNMELKRKAWVEIAEHVNIISPTKRTYTDVRKKVSDMKTSAKRKMLRYLKESLVEGNKSPLVKPQIDERLLDILQENGVIPPYKCILKRGMSCPDDIQKHLSEEEVNRPKLPVGADAEEPLSSGSVSIPVSVSCSPSITVDSVATHTPSSGYDTQSDPHRLKHLRESVDRLTSSVDKLGDSLTKISRSLEKIVESNQQMFSVINSNVVRILESQNNVQSICLPAANNHAR
ncbi:uncharacterized protein LOC128986522 isoform X2 [Macrosteles quadrilineatus]|uniref:uncharacterized protein LOC128986522 isoform X2 n=1 Tax=Macrosteles quadrilineatus TaxID=74068 RepID=UPI0023E30592|nr:uncharacterized protein LOC128986522 isoform X2 [Macrosteles quadrilineatus]